MLTKLVAPLTIVALLGLWQLACSTGLVPPFMLPSPVRVVRALVDDWPLLAGHAATSLAEAGMGLATGVALGFVAALAMDRFDLQMCIRDRSSSSPTRRWPSSVAAATSSPATW